MGGNGKILWLTEKRKVSELKPAKYNSKKITIICKNCFTAFENYPYHGRLFCKKECYSLWQKRHSEHTHFEGDIKLTCEFCKKEYIIRKAIHNARLNASPKGRNKLNFCSDDCRQSYSSVNISDWRSDMKGKNNPNWRGGISKEKARLTSTKRYKEFVRRILIRDNFKCRVCNSVVKPEVHHIVPFYKNKRLFFRESNVLTLCFRHHNQTKRKEEIYITIFKQVVNGIQERWTKNL